MWGVTWLVVVGASLYLVASRLLPWLLATLLSIYLGKAKVRLGGFGRRLEVFQLAFELGGLEVCVDNLRVTSSIITSDASNLLTLIATGVTVTIMSSAGMEVEDVQEQPESQVDSSSSNQSKRKTSWLLLAAQFLGLQLREVRVEVSKLPSVPDCRLVVELGELRLDSSVIHRTRLSLALFLFQGSVSLLRTSTASRPLLQGHFALQASTQALVGHGRVTSIEDVNLDLESLGLHVLSSLFQHVAPLKKSSGSRSKLADLAAFIPKAAQVKAEGLSGVLEHTDGVARLAGELKLLYLCAKCTELPRAQHIPDSHLTGQLSGLRIWPGEGSTEESVISCTSFKTLVQKEGSTLHSDTQVHELSGCYSEALDPWIAPVSWLVRSVEQRKAATALVVTEPEPTPSWLAGLQHQHQMDAWNSDLCVVEGSTEELTSGKLSARRRYVYV